MGTTFQGEVGTTMKDSQGVTYYGTGYNKPASLSPVPNFNYKSGIVGGKPAYYDSQGKFHQATGGYYQQNPADVTAGISASNLKMDSKSQKTATKKQIEVYKATGVTATQQQAQEEKAKEEPLQTFSQPFTSYTAPTPAYTPPTPSHIFSSYSSTPKQTQVFMQNPADVSAGINAGSLKMDSTSQKTATSKQVEVFKTTGVSATQQQQAEIKPKEQAKQTAQK